MFTFDATPLTFVGLLVMFAWCTVWCTWELTRARTTSQRISGALHLLMAAVMLLMVPGALWRPLTSVIGTPALTLVFALATAWFVGLAVEGWREAGRRGAAHPAAHAAMFAAMTWHLAAMAIMGAHMSAGAAARGGMSGHGQMSGPAGTAGQGGMSMAEWRAAESQPGGVMWLIALIGVPFMAYLLVAGIAALVRVAQPRAAANDACPCGADCRCGPSCACATAHPALPEGARLLAVIGAGAGASEPIGWAAPAVHLCRVESPVGSPGYRLAALSDAGMNLGMFWMSTGLMTALLPFFRHLAF